MKRFFAAIKDRMSGKEVRMARFVGLMALFAILALAYGWQILRFRNHFGLHDWDFTFFLHQYWHIAIFSFKQVPLWNPYICGGMPFIGRPDVSVLPFPIIFVSLFGVMAGLRIMALFYIFLAMTGMFCLCRFFRIKTLPAMIASIIFSMNGCFALRVMAGHLGWLSAAYLPWIFLFYLKGLKKARYVFLSSVFLAFTALEGSHILIFTAVFLSVFSFLYSFQQKTIRPLLALALALMFCVLFSGPKLFPMIEMMSRFPRLTDAGWAVPLGNLYDIFLERAQQDNLFQRFIKNTAWWEIGAYVGLVPSVLFVLSFKMIKKQWPLLLTAVFILLIGLGNFSGFAPWTVLHSGPVFSNMHIPTRIFIVFVFLLSLLCGLCLNSFAPRGGGREVFLRNAFLIALFCFVAWDLSAVNSAFFGEKFFSRLNVLRKPLFKENAFFQVELPQQYHSLFGATTGVFAQILQNHGVVDGYEAIPVERNAVPYSGPDYRGEFHLLGSSGNVSQSYWSPNRLVFHYDIRRPDVLVVNQNYDKGWKAFPPKRVRSHNGLISVEIDPADKGVILYYLPLSFVAGLLTCAVAIAVYAVMIRKKIEWKGPMGSGLW